jgi:hypothetical protein
MRVALHAVVTLHVAFSFHHPGDVVQTPTPILKEKGANLAEFGRENFLARSRVASANFQPCSKRR